MRYVVAHVDRRVRAEHRHYGEIVYTLGDRTDDRAASSTAEGVLETIYDAGNVTPPAEKTTRSSAGIRSPCRPACAALVFYGLWPARRRRRRHLRIETSVGGRMTRSTTRSLVTLAAALAIAPLLRGGSEGGPEQGDWSARRPRRSSRWSAPGSVAQDGADKVIKIDGGIWKARRRPTRMLIENARRLYGTTNEALMDDTKLFAMFPVAVLTIGRQLLERHHQREVQDHRPASRIARRASCSTSSRTATGCRPLQRHGEQRRALGVPQRHPPAAIATAARRTGRRPTRRIARSGTS